VSHSRAGTQPITIEAEQYKRFLRRANFEAAFQKPLAGLHAYRARKRLYLPEGSHGIVLRLDPLPSLGPPVNGSIAVKMYFDRPLSDVCWRYEAIIEHLQSLPVVPHLLLSPSLHIGGLDLDGLLVPVVSMPWVDGNELRKHFERGYDEKKNVNSRLIAAEFLLGMIELESAGVSLGDVCPANVMVQADGRLRLIDYDNMYVPALSGRERFSAASVQLVAPSLAATSFDDQADNGATLRLFAELFALSEARWRKYEAKDWLLKLDNRELQHELSNNEETHELLELYLFNESSASGRHDAPSAVLESCGAVKKALRRIIEQSDREYLKQLWYTYGKVEPRRKQAHTTPAVSSPTPPPIPVPLPSQDPTGWINGSVATSTPTPTPVPGLPPFAQAAPLPMMAVGTPPGSPTLKSPWRDAIERVPSFVQGLVVGVLAATVAFVFGVLLFADSEHVEPLHPPAPYAPTTDAPGAASPSEEAIRTCMRHMAMLGEIADAATSNKGRCHWMAAALQRVADDHAYDLAQHVEDGDLRTKRETTSAALSTCANDAAVEAALKRFTSLAITTEIQQPKGDSKCERPIENTPPSNPADKRKRHAPVREPSEWQQPSERY
jgi:hypothetical protein